MNSIGIAHNMKIKGRFINFKDERHRWDVWGIPKMLCHYVCMNINKGLN